MDFDTDSNGSSVRQVPIGVNFRPTEDTILRLDYVRGGSFDRMQFSVATYF